MRNPMYICVCLGMLAIATTTHAQWVNFTDETDQRLDLSTVSMNDSEEKNLALGDLNGNGWTDVIVVRKVPFSTPGSRSDVLLMNEGGELVDRTNEFAPGFLNDETDARFVIIHDVTGNDWLDVVIATTFGQQPKLYRNLGTGPDGTWRGLADESSIRLPHITPLNQPGGPQFCGVAAGDVTGNGAPDLYFSNYRQFGATTDALLINDGNGFFTDETEERLGNLARVAFGTGAWIADMNNNGHADIVKISTLFSVSPFNTTGVFTLYNNGDGVFTEQPFQTIETSVPYMFAVSDLNNSGMLDLFIVRDTQDRVYTAQHINPDGTVNYQSSTISPSPRTTGFGGDIALGDIDNNGYTDVGVSPVDVDIQNCSGPSAGEFALLQNSGDGNIFDPWPSNDDQNIHVRPHDMKFVDLDNNGCLDIVMGLCTGWRVFMQDDCDPECEPVDLNCDSIVDSEDLFILLSQWGECADPNDCPADLDGSGVVDSEDLFILLSEWG